MNSEPDRQGFYHFDCGATFDKAADIEWFDDQLPRVKLPCLVCRVAALRRG